MKALKPSEYAAQFYGGAYSSKTIRNWIKAGKQLQGVERVETTPTGHYLLHLKVETKSNVSLLVEAMKAKAA